MQEAGNHPFSSVESALISLLGSAVFGAQLPEKIEADIDSVLKEAEKQTVFPYVFQIISNRNLSNVNPSWVLRFQKHIAHNVQIVHQHFMAHALMTEAGIPYTIMKGYASAQYYPEPLLRSMGDVDLYVGEQSMQKVRSFLTQKGFAVSSLNHSHHWAFTKDQAVLEVHWLPSGVPASDNGTIKSRFDDLLEKHVLIETEQGSMYLPDALHHGMILLLHTANHLSAGGIGLRHLMDWLVFESSMPEQKFCELFEDDLKQMGLWQLARVLTAVGVQFFGCEPRAFCKEISPELASSILTDIFDGGNFGTKDSRRLMESKLLRDEITRGIDGKSGARHFLRFLNRKSQLAMPITKKVPILLPIGWVKVAVRHRKVKKRSPGESVKLRELAQGAKHREALYQQLRLYEDD